MERTYTIPLRREWIKTVRYKRAKKTIRAIREFMEQHMKATDVKIGKHLNEEVWKHGIANPPSRVRVNCVKDKDGIVTVELFGKPLGAKAAPKAPEKKDEKKPAAKKDVKADEKKSEAKPETKPAAKKEVKAEEKKPEAKPAEKKVEEKAPASDAKAAEKKSE